jgi:hypothetical protein
MPSCDLTLALRSRNLHLSNEVMHYRSQEIYRVANSACQKQEFGLVFKLGTGVNVMIPIFGDVHQYLANKIGKKMAFS